MWTYRARLITLDCVGIVLNLLRACGFLARYRCSYECLLPAALERDFFFRRASSADVVAVADVG